MLKRSICLTARYVADATRIISYRVLNECEKHIDFVINKNIEQTLVCISTIIVASELFTDSKV